MLMALLRGKLSREQENLEDILASNVFGLLKYLPPEEGLFPFLSHAQTLDGHRPLEGAVPGAKVEYQFWPWYAEEDCNGCEPDVELRILWPNGRKMRVFIECKYLSGKSSEEDDGQEVVETKREPPVDQLAREWSNLTCLAKRDNADPVLIYLTRDIRCPREEIEASRRVLLRESTNATFSCCWLSWHQLYEIRPNKPSQILADIKTLLERLNLVFFHGISAFQPVGTIDWRFMSQIDTRTLRSKICCDTVDHSFDFSFSLIPGIPGRVEDRLNDP